MAIRTRVIGAVPVDVGAALNLDGKYVFENVGSRSLWFVVADAAGEPAPSDLTVGHWLAPCARTPMRAGVGEPVWVWSQHPTRLGGARDWLS